MATFTQEIKNARVGILTGIILGYLVGRYFIPSIDLQSLFVTQSIFENISGSIIQTTTKAGLLFAGVGGTMGYLVEKYWIQIKRGLG